MQFILLGVTLLILIINVLVGLRRGFSYTLLRFATLIVAAVAAFILAKVLAGALGDRLIPLLETTLSSNETIGELIQTQPDAIKAVATLADMLVAPILFLLCYMVLKLITLLGYFALRKMFRLKKNKSFLLRRLGGAGMGLLTGLIGVLVFVTPVIGYTAMVSRTVEELNVASEEQGEGTLAYYNQEFIAPAAETPVASQLYNGIGSKLFKGLTTAPWGEEKTDLETEWFAVIHVANEVSKLSGSSFTEFGDAESAAIHSAIAGIGDSHILLDLGSGILNGMSNAWLKGETFLGIAAPDMGDENIKMLLNGVLRVFSTTNNTTLEGDLETFAQMFDLMIKHDMFQQLSAEGEGGFAQHVVTSGFLEEARTLLLSNERMKPITVALSDVGMRLLVSQLGLPEDYRETCGELMNEMSDVLQKSVVDGKINTETLSQNLTTVLAKHEVDVPEEATEIIAQGLVDEFTPEELGTLSIDEITDRLISRFSAVDGVESVISQ